MKNTSNNTIDYVMNIWKIQQTHRGEVEAMFARSSTSEMLDLGLRMLAQSPDDTDFDLDLEPQPTPIADGSCDTHKLAIAEMVSAKL